MNETFTCPRRIEDGADRDDGPFVFSGSNKDTYRSDNTCSYCGSFNPDALMARIEAGDIELGPTDKSYKIYIELPNPDAGKRVKIGSESGPAFRNGEPTKDDLTLLERIRGRYNRTSYGIAPQMKTMKFYFQHLSIEQRKRFVELLNEKKLKIGYPGHFYVLPFFIGR